VHPAQLTLRPIHNHKTKYENISYKNGYGTHHTQKKKNVILSKCDNVIGKFKYTCNDKSSFFFGLRFCTSVKNKYEKRVLGHFFKKKKSLDLQKIKNHVVTISY